MSVIKFNGLSTIEIDDIVFIVSDKRLEITKLYDKDCDCKYIYCLKKIDNGEFVKFNGVASDKKIKRKSEKIIAGKYFYSLPVELWRPKNIVQYVRFKFKRIYGYIPLDLNWNDEGYIDNPRTRSKCWAYAKHLIDKFNKLKISKKRLQDYIDWCFDTFDDVNINMGFLSCNSWIDQYYSVNKRKKIQIGYDKNSEEIWNNIVNDKG